MSSDVHRGVSHLAMAVASKLVFGFADSPPLLDCPLPTPTLRGVALARTSDDDDKIILSKLIFYLLKLDKVCKKIKL